MTTATNHRKAFRRPNPEAARLLKSAVDELLSEPTAPSESDSPAAVKIPETKGRIVELEVETLLQNPVNARRLVSSVALQALEQKLEKHGQLSPILIYYDEQGRPALIDGHRRLRCAKSLGWRTIRCEVRAAPATQAELYLLSRVANAQHETQTPLDDALVWTDLLEKRVFSTQAELAREVGVSETEVSRTISLAEIPSRMMLLIVERPFLHSLRMLNALRNFAKSHSTEDMDTLLRELDAGALSARQLEKRIAAKTPVDRLRPRSDRHAFSWNGVAGEVKRFDKDGRLELSIRKLSPEALMSLEEALLQLLSPQLPLPR